MISKQKKFIYIHYPKTAGTSIEKALSKYSEDRIVYKKPEFEGRSDKTFEVISDEYNLTKHTKLKVYKSKLDKAFYNSAFKFGIIRNPWDLMISWYFSPHSGRSQWDREKFIKLLNSVPRPRNYFLISSWLERASISLLNKVPSISRVLPDVPLDRDINYLIRYESINEDFKNICEILDIEYEPLLQLHQSNRKHYSQYYDDDLKELVASKFDLEIKFMNYEF